MRRKLDLSSFKTPTTSVPQVATSPSSALSLTGSFDDQYFVEHSSPSGRRVLKLRSEKDLTREELLAIKENPEPVLTASPSSNSHPLSISPPHHHNHQQQVSRSVSNAQPVLGPRSSSADTFRRNTSFVPSAHWLSRTTADILQNPVGRKISQQDAEWIASSDAPPSSSSSSSIHTPAPAPALAPVPVPVPASVPAQAPGNTESLAFEPQQFTEADLAAAQFVKCVDVPDPHFNSDDFFQSLKVCNCGRVARTHQQGGAKSNQFFYCCFRDWKDPSNCHFNLNVPSFESDRKVSADTKFILRCACAYVLTNSIISGPLSNHPGRHYYTCKECSLFVWEDTLDRLYAHHDWPFLMRAEDVVLTIEQRIAAKPPLKVRDRHSLGGVCIRVCTQLTFMCICSSKR